MFTEKEIREFYFGSSSEKRWRRVVKIYIGSHYSITLEAIKYRSFWAVQMIDCLPTLFATEHQGSDNPKLYNCLILDIWNLKKVIQKINYPDSKNENIFRYSLVDSIWGEDFNEI